MDLLRYSFIGEFYMGKVVGLSLATGNYVVDLVCNVL